MIALTASVDTASLPGKTEALMRLLFPDTIVSEPAQTASVTTESTVETVVSRVRQMINSFEIKPGERINEVALSRQLGVSRTPLREGLNRLAIAGFLISQPAKGFFCRDIQPRATFELFQMRTILEVSSARLAARHAQAQDIALLEQFVHLPEGTAPADTAALLTHDERFHEAIATIGGNDELIRVLNNIRARIRPVRWIDIEHRPRSAPQQEHQRILDALALGDEEAAARTMEEHVMCRQDALETSIRLLFGRIYVPAPLQN